MDVISKKLILFVLNLLVLTAQAYPIQSCLNQINQKEHRLIRQAKTLQCFRDFYSSVDIDGCFKLAREVKLNSTELTQSLYSICFYETTLSKNLNSCTSKARVFTTADLHDDAIFECYRQFENQLSQKQCIELSRQLTYPTKKNYLLSHCLNNI